MKFAILIPLSLILQFCTICTTSATDNNGRLTGNSTSNVSEVNNASGLDQALIENSESVNQVEYYDINSSLGLVSANDKRYEQDGSIRIFNQDGSLWYELSSKDENKEGVITLKKKEFMPFRINADELLVVMNSVGEDNRYYHVIVNEDTKLTKYVRKDDPVLQLGTWEKYILNCFAVEFDSKNNPLRDSPNGQILDSEVDRKLTFRPLKIQGEWLAVRLEASRKNTNAGIAGWIRWKDNGKLILRLFEIA
jgi:hypothetical protein